MLLTLCALLSCADSTPTYSGRNRELDVSIPRFEVEVVIDGGLRRTDDTFFVKVSYLFRL